MKIQKITIALLLAMAVFFTSCEKWIDTDMNIDPDSPSDVPLAMLLPSVQANMAYDLCGNDAVMPVNIWMQQLNGYARQAQIYARYIYSPADVNNLWDGIYSVSGMDLKVLIDKAVESDAPHSAAVGQILMAYLMAITTDLFGDIPYSEAFLGTGNLTPAADAQQSVYASIDELLTTAITNLGEEDLVGIKGDMMHGGSASAWRKTAYALKARNAINLSERNGAAAYTAALAALGNAYTSNADNLDFTFGVGATELSPITQFVDQRNDIVMGQFFMDYLNSTGDPRIPEYADLADDGTYTGGYPADGTSAGRSFPGDFISNKNAPVTANFMTYAECKFIEAEAKLSSTGAADAYRAGIIASVSAVLGDTTGTTAWFDSNFGGVTDATITLEDIIMQKYVANFGQIQPYNDYRRTNFPAGLLPPTGAVVPLPRRYPYSQDEITYNHNIEDLWQVSVFLTTNVWWDAN
ncbi:MAG: SusD/RagB family nutrient-binding outer membrane lipoprotein [Bacteroidales bacterium]|nr:SusD/RagB family nutrient-binding outer membrane lipoprotein [Bacteroidales bacterium]MCF8392025.1 SusD/RagB family nutrient-binding outer membrane lipoprotein [Bacteroidales bacterium]